MRGDCRSSVPPPGKELQSVLSADHVSHDVRNSNCLVALDPILLYSICFADLVQSRLDPATGKFIHFKHDPRNRVSLGDNLVWPVLEDRRGSVWLGTHGGSGLERFDKKRNAFEHYGYYWISSLYEDREKTLSTLSKEPILSAPHNACKST